MLGLKFHSNCSVGLSCFMIGVVFRSIGSYHTLNFDPLICTMSILFSLALCTISWTTIVDPFSNPLNDQDIIILSSSLIPILVANILYEYFTEIKRRKWKNDTNSHNSSSQIIT
jgi:hypothetical protein